MAVIIVTNVYFIRNFVSVTETLFTEEASIRVLLVAACAVAAFVAAAFRDY